ncbi:MAG TPA: hypothetical protein VNF29_12915 [Candidatus Binataceae bacterium]|nr:hypothetical protein [Candidatus Binataceae bacterium]
MKRLLVGMISAVFVLAAAGIGSAKDLSTMSLEEDFVNAIGTCGPSSNIAGALAKTKDYGVRTALRQSLIQEAADDAAGVEGKNPSHADCMQKELSKAGYTTDQMAVLPECVKHDWPDPLDDLGDCVKNKAHLEAVMKKK